MSKTEQQAHKATFKEKKKPFYKRAIFPWVIIYTAFVLIVGIMLGYTVRSDFANEVRSEVKAQMVVVEDLKAQKQ